MALFQKDASSFPKLSQSLEQSVAIFLALCGYMTSGDAIGTRDPLSANVAHPLDGRCLDQKEKESLPQRKVTEKKRAQRYRKVRMKGSERSL